MRRYPGYVLFVVHPADPAVLSPVQAPRPARGTPVASQAARSAESSSADYHTGCAWWTWSEAVAAVVRFHVTTEHIQAAQHSTYWPTSMVGAGSPVVPAPPNLGGRKARTSWNSTALAYLGDSVWEVCTPWTAGSIVDTYLRLKPWSPLNHLLTHVILVRVACGSYIRIYGVQRHRGMLPCGQCLKLQAGNQAKMTVRDAPTWIPPVA